MSLHLYSAAYPNRLSPVVFQSLLAALPPVLQQKVAKYRRWQDAYGSLLGKHLLRKGLKDWGLPADLTRLLLTSYGRPYLENGPDFNISHSGNRVVCMLSGQGRVGIDLEETTPVAIGDFQSQFSAAEWQNITGSAAPLLAFYEHWTAKESLIKADGKGLSIPLDRIDIGIDPVIQLDDHRWHLRKLSLYPNYACHLACESPIGEMTVEEVDPEALMGDW